MAEVWVDVDTADFDDEELIEALRSRGYIVTKAPLTGSVVNAVLSPEFSIAHGMLTPRTHVDAMLVELAGNPSLERRLEIERALAPLYNTVALAS